MNGSGIAERQRRRVPLDDLDGMTAARDRLLDLTNLLLVLGEWQREESHHAAGWSEHVGRVTDGAGEMLHRPHAIAGFAERAAIQQAAFDVPGMVGLIVKDPQRRLVR